jgi:hypothetical protein
MSHSVKPEMSFSRRRLYEMVWKEPVEDIAARVGLSGRGLAKLCERNAIPVPPRGYWQRKLAGQPMERRPPLVELPGEKFPDLGLRIKEAIQNSDRQPKASADPAERSPFLALYEREASVRRTIKAAKSLRKLHPVPAKWVAETRLSERLIDAEAPLEGRIFRIYSGLLNFAEKAGFVASRIGANPSSCAVSFRAAHLLIRVEEQVCHHRRPVTDEERSEAPWMRGKWRQVKERTGELALSVQPAAKFSAQFDFPTVWRDGAGGLLEEKLPSVFAGIVAMTAAVEHHMAVEHEKARDAALRLEAAEERRRQREREEERKSQLRRDARAWREAADLRAYVAAVRAADVAGIARLPLPLTDWVQWSLAVADEIDPLR